MIVIRTVPLFALLVSGVMLVVILASAGTTAFALGFVLVAAAAVVLVSLFRHEAGRAEQRGGRQRRYRRAYPSSL